MCGSKTSNCRNLLNIRANGLIFLLKDRQLNLQENIGDFNFVHDQPFPQYLQLKLPLPTSFSVRQILTRNSFKNKTVCYAIAICGRSFTNRVKKNALLDFKVKNNSLQKSSPFL